jgi:hypothetical protein
LTAGFSAGKYATQVSIANIAFSSLFAIFMMSYPATIPTKSIPGFCSRVALFAAREML